jgi:hypothetical protein
MKKVSEFIGFNVSLGEPINHDNYLLDSFLNALWTMVDDSFEPNEIFSNLIVLTILFRNRKMKNYCTTTLKY